VVFTKSVRANHGPYTYIDYDKGIQWGAGWWFDPKYEKVRIESWIYYGSRTHPGSNWGRAEFETFHSAR